MSPLPIRLDVRGLTGLGRDFAGIRSFLTLESAGPVASEIPS